MLAAKHSSYEQEKEKLCLTLQLIEDELNKTIIKKRNIENEVSQKKKCIDYDNSQDYTELMVNTDMYKAIDSKYKRLTSCKKKPYFARIDFISKDTSSSSSLYIGKTSLQRDEDIEPIVVDWRSPVANLYYEGKLGSSEYVCPEGKIKVDMNLKRMFVINDNILLEIYDEDVGSHDETLLACLSENTDSRLKDIVSTIQLEQNAIIRTSIKENLIIQGAAGSGKTTIALHRIAYLIYTYSKSFRPEDFLIIAPNKLFLSYISEVMPELGVEGVKQTTFNDFALELLDKKCEFVDINDNLISFISNKDRMKHQHSLYIKVYEFKASLLYKEILYSYIRIIEHSFIPKKDLTIEGIVLFKYETINSFFLDEHKSLPLYKRIEALKKYLFDKIIYQKDSIIDRIYDYFSGKLNKIIAEMTDENECKQLLKETEANKCDIIDNFEKHIRKAINKYFAPIVKKSVLEYYKSLMKYESIYNELFSALADKELADFIRAHTLKLLKSGLMEIEDVVAVIYLKYKLYGLDRKSNVKHTVIDEGQDLSAFQYYLLKLILSDSSFTILGDLSQSIHFYRGIKSWNDLLDTVLYKDESKIIPLKKSYRTTIEIMTAANKVISKCNSQGIVLAEPVIRHGETIRILQKSDINEIVYDITNKIKYLLTMGFKSMAIICKDISGCKSSYQNLQLSGLKECSILTGREDYYSNGIVVVPSYLVKGFEFDVVFIPDGDDNEYTNNELDIKLLYISMTRALHKLYIYYCEEISPLLSSLFHSLCKPSN